jgi:hypothetical protein
MMFPVFSEELARGRSNAWVQTIQKKVIATAKKMGALCAQGIIVTEYLAREFIHA